MSGSPPEQLNVQYALATPATPGAVAIIQLHGQQCAEVLRQLTGVSAWPPGVLRLVSFGEIDEGLATRIDEHTAQIMPHGGPRVVQRVLQELRAMGLNEARQCAPDRIYPEASDRYDAMMLEAVARAASPMAVQPLLAQAAIWRKQPVISKEDHARSKRLARLLSPPIVVVAGPPNVGKSTLSNTLLGRDLSIAFNEPGTTRDYTAAQIELLGLVVHWHDTPGLRTTHDPIEARAIELARGLIDRADLLIAMTDAAHDWPQLPREPDLRIANKADISPRDDSDLNISAMSRQGIDQLVSLVRDTLLDPEDFEAAHVKPWLFDDRLLERTAHAAGKDVSGLLP